MGNRAASIRLGVRPDDQGNDLGFVRVPPALRSIQWGKRLPGFLLGWKNAIRAVPCRRIFALGGPC